MIAWVQYFHKLSFQEACVRLGSVDLPQAAPRPSRLPETIAQPPDEKWQHAARRIVEKAQEQLWAPEGERALVYLCWGRGLNDDIITAARLGYVPGAPSAWETVEGVHVPCGITIPWIAEGAIWGIKVRRSAGEQRYQQVSGGNIGGGLYLADGIEPRLPLVITEGEFDALTAWQAGWGIASAVAIGSASHARIDCCWYRRLLVDPRILACMDADQAGAGAAAQLMAISGAVRSVRVSAGKDMNEFYLHEGEDAVREWIRAMLG